MRTGRPRVIVKIAASLDGRVALANGESHWITSAAARADVQRLRAECSAVLTGIETVLADDPQLKVRDPAIELLGRQPLRVRARHAACACRQRRACCRCRAKRYLHRRQ